MDEILKTAIEEKDKLINNMQTIMMSTIDSEGKPNSSYAPSVIDSYGNYYVYISKLSKHTLNMLNNPNVSMMIIEDESKTENVFGRKRFTMDSDVKVIDRDSEEWKEVILLMENKFGETMTYLKDLTDFYLFKLKPESGLLVHGFARAFKFVGDGLNEIQYLNDKGHNKK